MIFETVDIQYNTVSLSKDTWENHIISEHPEMTGTEYQVQQTIENTDNITKDNVAQTRYYYMDHNDSSLAVYGKMIKVCVNIDSGSVKSAYFTDYMSTREIKI